MGVEKCVRKSMSRTLFVTGAIVTALSMPVLSAHVVRAIGITPPEVFAPSVLRNSKQTKYVTLSKDPNQIRESLMYRTEVRSEYAGVIEIAETVEVPAGKQTAQIPFVINTKDLSNGTYTVTILFYEKGSEDDEVGEDEGAGVGAGVSITAGIAAQVTFTVGGEEKVSYEISNIQAKTTETDDPVPVEFTINNTGNVIWKPEKIECIFYDQQDSENTVTVTVAGADLPSTDPGSEQIISLNVEPELIQSTYILSLVVYDDGKEVFSGDSQVFDVFPPNTLAQSGEVISQTTNKNQYAIGENIRLNAEFQNAGEIRVSGIMVTSIEKDGSLIDLRKTDQLDIDAGEVSEFEDIFSLDKPGTYSLVIYVEYGNKKTAKKTLEIEIIDPQAQGKGSGTEALPYILLIALSVLIIVIALVVRMRRHKNTPAQTTSVQSTPVVSQAAAPQQPSQPANEDAVGQISNQKINKE